MFFLSSNTNIIFKVGLDKSATEEDFLVFKRSYNIFVTLKYFDVFYNSIY